MESSKGVSVFDGHGNFVMWKAKMRAFLNQNGMEDALDERPEDVTDKEWKKIKTKALATIQLSLSDDVLSGLLDEVEPSTLWSKLEANYATKSIANKLRLKARLYTFRMTEGTSIVDHVNQFLKLIYELEQMGSKVEDEDKAVLLIVSLPHSFTHFKEIILYNNNNQELKFDDVKSSLLSKQSFDHDGVGSEKPEGLTVRGRGHDRRGSGGNKYNSRSKSKGPRDKNCFYCKKPGHWKKDCQERKAAEKGNGKQHSKPQASVVESESDGEVLVATSLSASSVRSSTSWVLDSGCTFHMCPNKGWFSTYEEVTGGVVLMGNDARCHIRGVGDVRIKMHDGVIRTLSKVYHIPELKRNLISLGTLEKNGCKYVAENGILRISKGALVVLKG